MPIAWVALEVRRKHKKTVTVAPLLHHGTWAAVGRPNGFAYAVVPAWTLYELRASPLAVHPRRHNRSSLAL